MEGLEKQYKTGIMQQHHNEDLSAEQSIQIMPSPALNQKQPYESALSGKKRFQKMQAGLLQTDAAMGNDDDSEGGTRQE